MIENNMILEILINGKSSHKLIVEALQKINNDSIAKIVPVEHILAKCSSLDENVRFFAIDRLIRYYQTWVSENKKDSKTIFESFLNEKNHILRDKGMLGFNLLGEFGLMSLIKMFEKTTLPFKKYIIVCTLGRSFKKYEFESEVVDLFLTGLKSSDLLIKKACFVELMNISPLNRKGEIRKEYMFNYKNIYRLLLTISESFNDSDKNFYKIEIDNLKRYVPPS